MLVANSVELVADHNMHIKTSTSMWGLAGCAIVWLCVEVEARSRYFINFTLLLLRLLSLLVTCYVISNVST